MKHLFYTIIIFALPHSIHATSQEFEKPDYNKIKKIIKDEQSEYYYPTIMKRFLDSDTTMTVQDYRVLYYGYIFHDNYSAYAHSFYTDSLNAVLNSDSLMSKDYNNIIRFEKQILDESPFNLRDLNMLAYAYYMTGDTLLAFQTSNKIDMLTGAILSTGDGIKEKTAWHVISVGHEYDILNILGFQFAGNQSLTKKGYDYLEVSPNEYEMEGFYFDVNMILDSEAKLFK